MSSTRRIRRPNGGMGPGSGPGSKDNERNAGMRGVTQMRKPSPVLKKLAYPLMYMLIWTVPTAVCIYQSVTGKPASFGIATVDKACIVIQGFADTLIYGFNESSLSV